MLEIDDILSAVSKTTGDSKYVCFVMENGSIIIMSDYDNKEYTYQSLQEAEEDWILF